MTEPHTDQITQALQDGWLQTLIQSPELHFSVPASPCTTNIRLIRLDEINEEEHQAYRQALANVYASLDPEQPARLLYLLDGGPSGVALYFGVVTDCKETDVHEAMKNLRGALEGQLPGINFGEDVTPNVTNILIEKLSGAPLQAVVLGAPTSHTNSNEKGEQDFQGIDRIVRALQSGLRKEIQTSAKWHLSVISQPLPRLKIRKLLDDAYALSSQVALLVSTSVQASSNTSQQKNVSKGTSEASGINEGTSDTLGKNDNATETSTKGKSKNSGESYNSRGTNESSSKAISSGTNESHTKTRGSSHTSTVTENFSLADTEGGTFGITKEIANKRAQHLLDYLDKQLIVRLQKGLTKGLFHSAVFLGAENQSTYQRLKNTVRATFQGSESTMSPLDVYDLPEGIPLQLLHLPVLEYPLDGNELLFHSMHIASSRLGSLLTGDELAIFASLPQHEIQGIRRRKTVEFIVDLPDVDKNTSLDLGCVIDRGRRYPNNRVLLARNDLNKHVFVTGVTGAGKTTTCLNLLLESDLPFLVIEPAKTEYRELATTKLRIEYYRPNGDNFQSLRINPFALIRKEQRVKSHAGFLKNAFAAVFPMEASMPMMVEAAILAAYEDKGWDVDENTFLSEGDPFDPTTRAWPTMSDMIQKLDMLIPTYGLGKEFEEKYRGSLVSRLRSLTDGILGQVLDVPQSIDFKALLGRRAVIELEELQGGDEKALLMALLLGAINETMRDRHAREPEFRQLTLIEEAHRLLARPEPGNRTAALAVESFADMLAEVRKYGTGIIIADQIPAKLIPDVIKNTHSKIVHRLFAEDDRRAMGEAMMMDENQRNFLPNLATGEAIIFCGGWHGPAHAAIRNDRAQTDNRREFDLDAKSIVQLWRERTRYYPQFCRLGWLSTEPNEADKFARFTRETRQAHNHLLRVIVISSEADVQTLQRGESAFNHLKAWQERWQQDGLARQPEYEQWRQAQPIPEHWPQGQLAAAWMALLLDANPRLQAKQKKHVQTLQPLNDTDWCFLADTSDSLLALLEESKTPEEWSQSMQKNRALKNHIDHLTNFRNF